MHFPHIWFCIVKTYFYCIDNLKFIKKILINNFQLSNIADSHTMLCEYTMLIHYVFFVLIFWGEGAVKNPTMHA